MPRYFFTVHDGQIIPDQEGTELPGPAEAKVEASATLLQLLKDRQYPFLWDNHEWKMVVSDESGAIVTTIRFSAFVEDGPKASERAPA